MRSSIEGDFHPPLLFEADSGSGVASAAPKDESFYTPSYEGVDPSYRTELEKLDGVLQQAPRHEWPLSVKKAYAQRYGIRQAFGMSQQHFRGLITLAREKGIFAPYVGLEADSNVERNDYFVGPNTLRALRALWKTAQDSLEGKEPRFIKDSEWGGLYLGTIAKLGEGSELAEYLQYPTSSRRKTFAVAEFFNREHIDMALNKRDEEEKEDEVEVVSVLPYREVIALITERYLGKEGAMWTSRVIASEFKKREGQLNSLKLISVEADTRLPESIVRILHFVDWINFHSKESFVNGRLVFSSKITEGEFVRSLAIGGKYMQERKIPVVDALFEKVASFVERKLQKEEAAARMPSL